MDKTFIMLKPDAVRRKLAGEIISRIEAKNLSITNMEMGVLPRARAEEHYGEHSDKPFFGELVDFITSGPVVRMKVEGPKAVEVMRTLMGATDPAASPPGTIRGDYSHYTYQLADKKNIAVRNLLHASGNKEDAEHELKLWFEEKELHSYKTVHDMFVS